MANYYIKDGQFYEIPDDVLMHWKYIKREKVNGKWRYIYDVNAGKTQSLGINKSSNASKVNGAVNKKASSVSQTGKMTSPIDKAKRWLENLKNGKSGNKVSAVNKGISGNKTTTSKSKNVVTKAIDKIGDAIGFDDKKAYEKSLADVSRARAKTQGENLRTRERETANKQYQQARKKSEDAYKNYMNTPLSLLTNPKDKLSKLGDKMSDVADEISKIGDKATKRVDAAKNSSAATKAKNNLIDSVKDYEKLTEKRDELEKRVNKTKSSLDSAENTRKRRATDLDRAKMTNLGLDDAKREYQKATKEVEKAREQYNKAKEQYDGNDSDIKALKKKLDNLSVSYQNSYDDYEDIMDQISVELGRKTKYKTTTIPTGITSSSKRR